MEQRTTYRAGFALDITLNRMKLSLDARRTWTVAGCFGSLIGLGVVMNVLVGSFPTPQEDCISQCKLKGLEGQMIGVYPPGMTGGVRGRGPSECKCFRWGAAH
jgi:hypothetical protein